MKRIAILVFFVASLGARGQQLLENPNIELITVAEGLPLHNVISVVQDRDGFIWVSSLDGLVRYDGYSFISIEGRPALPNRTIYSMTVDLDGFIWLGHLSGFVTKLNPRTLEALSFELPGGNVSEVNRIFCDSKGKIWAGVSHVGLFAFDGNSKFDFLFQVPDLPTQYPDISPAWFNTVAAMAEVENGFWLGTGNGLFFYDTAQGKVTQVKEVHRPGEYPIAILSVVSEKDELWMGTYGSGLIRYNTKTKKWKSYEYQVGPRGTNNIVNLVVPKNNKEFWIATSGKGIGVFNRETERFTFYSKIEDFGSGPVCSSLLIDRSGILWSASDKGLFKWNTRTSKFDFTKVVTTRSTNGAYYGVSHVLQVNDSLRLVGTTMATGLFIKKGERVMTREFGYHPNGEPFQFVTDLQRDSKGNIWVLTRDNLFKLDSDLSLSPDHGINRLLAAGQVPFFKSILETSDGELWVGSSRNGLFKKDNKGKWTHVVAGSETLKNNRILKLIEDVRGRKWMLHPVEGITRFDPGDNKYVHFSGGTGLLDLTSNKLTDIASAPNGDVWICSVEGITVFGMDSDSIKAKYTTKDGLPSQVFYSMVIDDRSNVWLTSSKGLVVITKTGESKVFDYIDGVKGIAHSMFLRKGSKGQLHIATYQGYYTFDPTTVLETVADASVPVITSIRNDSTLIFDHSKLKSIDVPQERNSVAIEFSALNFQNPLRNIYLYKMQGLDKNWTETNDHVVNYSGIPSGTYQFRVRLKGQPEGTETSIGIVVATPYYKQTWFTVLLFIVLLAAGLLLYRVRLMQVRREERLKSEFNQKLAEVEMKALRAQMNPHFIFNSLNSINRYIVKSDPETASLYLTKFSKLIRLILDNSNHKLVSLEHELNALVLYIELEALRFNNKFTYKLTIGDKVGESFVGVPPMIIQPFIENAIWHGLLHKTTPGHLEITIDRPEDSIICTITDNGVGRKKAAEMKSKSISSNKSYGMKITSDRLSMLNEESEMSSVQIIDLTDEYGNASGTRVIVTIAVAELEPEF